MAYDILTDIDNTDNPFELLFRGGDFIVDDTSEQEVRLALLAGKGNWKQFPLVGAELFKLLHTSVRSNYQQLITTELERVGYKVTRYGGFDNVTGIDIDVEPIN